MTNTKKSEPKAHSAPHGASQADINPEIETVSVPEELQPLFQRAERYAAQYFQNKHERPQQGTIEIAGERYILVRAASMSTEFFDLVSSLYQDRGEQEAQSVAAGLLFDIGHAIGKADAQAFHKKLNISDPIEKLSLGPVHFAYAGWAFVEILPQSNPTQGEDYLLLYDHPFSFEADTWMRQGRRATNPVCLMNAGYSSGWCEESFGFPLVAAEVECRAKGDKHCRFIMAPPHRIRAQLARFFPKDQLPKRSSSIPIPEFFERKRLEDELCRSRDELERRVEQRTRELEARNKQLESEIADRKKAQEEQVRLQEQILHAQKLESLGVLAGGLAHDFNNLLMGILGNADLALVSQNQQGEQKRHLEQILKTAKEASGITQQMLTYAGQCPFVIAPVNINDLVEEMSSLLRVSISKNISFSICSETDLPLVEADATQIRQVIMNLVINAAESIGDKHGTLTVKTGWFNISDYQPLAVVMGKKPTQGDHVFLRVSDDGCGMDESTQSKIFDPFFSTKFVGRGLGMASVLGIINGHHGAIAFESKPQVGTTFEVILPAVTQPKTQSQHFDPIRDNLNGSEMILVADDEQQVRIVVSEMLQSAGYQVLLAQDGQEAVDLYRTHSQQIDMVLLDLTMPRMDGAQAYQLMRQINPAIRAVFSSGFDEQQVTGHLAPNKLTAFLQKPYQVQTLLAKIRQTLDGG